MGFHRDSISMLLFCMSIEPALKRLLVKYIIVVYADDIVIGHDKSIRAIDVIKEVQNKVLDYGLLV